MKHTVLDFDNGAGSACAKAEARLAVLTGHEGELHFVAGMPFRRGIRRADRKGGAYQSFRDIEPADAAQGVLDKAGFPHELAGVGQALPRTAAAGIGMRAGSRAFFRS